MSTAMKLSQFKAFFDHYKLHDCSDDANHSNELQLNYIGYVDVTTPSKKETYKIYSDPSVETAIAVRTTNDEYIIVFGQDYLNKRLDIHNNRTVLMGTIAHEVGHLINGDLDIENTNKEDWVTINKEDQIRLQEKAIKTKTIRDYDRYFRCVFGALVRGGCLEKELKADLTGIRFTPIENIIIIHTEDFNNTNKNPYTTLEKVNRIKNLNLINRTLWKTTEEIENYCRGHSMEVYLVTNELRPWYEVLDEIIQTDTLTGEDLLEKYDQEFSKLRSDKPVETWILAEEKGSGYRHPDYYKLSYQFATMNGINVRKHTGPI